MREGVAMALQRLGDKDMDALIRAMQTWSRGTPLEQRAAAAAVCEPRLLDQAKHARAVLRLLDKITTSIRKVKNRKNKDFLTLRQGLGYCWSVAVAALPDEGKASLEKWLADTDQDIHWIMKENLKKNRLARMDASWVKKWQSKIG
jgi:3-methyladenine DNA glycosylase AlkC